MEKDTNKEVEKYKIKNMKQPKKNKLSAVKTNPKLKSKVTNYSKNSSGGKLVTGVKKAIKLYDKYSGASLLRKGARKLGKYMMKNAAATGPGKPKR